MIDWILSLFKKKRTKAVVFTPAPVTKTIVYPSHWISFPDQPRLNLTYDQSARLFYLFKATEPIDYYIDKDGDRMPIYKKFINGKGSATDLDETIHDYHIEIGYKVNTHINYDVDFINENYDVNRVDLAHFLYTTDDCPEHIRAYLKMKWGHRTFWFGS